MKTSIKYIEKSKSELIALLAEKENQLEKYQHQIKYQSDEINSLLEQLKLRSLRQFGRKSEESPHMQLSLFDEAELPKKAAEIIDADEEIHIKEHIRKKTPGRKPLPTNLSREQRIYDLSEAEKICNCGNELTHIKNETCEQLEIIPAKVYVIEHIKMKYACKKCEETIKTASMPKQPIPRSIASPGLLSYTIVSKFQDHLPLYRQEKILRRIGIDIPRATLSLWVIRAAEFLKPLYDKLRANILSYDVSYSDETTVQVIKELSKSINSKKYMWLFAGGPPNKFSYYYQYHPTRSHDVPAQFFTEYKGYIHCDGYSAYDALAAKFSGITLVGCLYHARRKFVEITKIAPKKEGVAFDVVNTIAKLAQIEEKLKTLTPDNRFLERKNQARVMLDQLHDYLIDVYPRIPPKSALGEACFYMLNQWPKLINYLKDGRLENSNNLSERAIKPFVIGRKGWLFANSVEGANSAAILYSLVETCKYHNIEPYDWFRHVLTHLPTTPEHEIINLLPFNVDPSTLRQ